MCEKCTNAIEEALQGSIEASNKSLDAYVGIYYASILAANREVSIRLNLLRKVLPDLSEGGIPVHKEFLQNAQIFSTYVTRKAQELEKIIEMHEMKSSSDKVS